ncbi:LacI family DNA-binding transcriptional regulator [Streptomyces endophyticus]|uniref:LacI family transcriptional regulator n=1 Tax=Streptomyces endophyticus TaxID=714166 RepID=A0ABU6FBR9_9ACTN|nr:LacI family DNA-binding transcriptional regulator [Streptomyces endophyticus]MEB8340918.1 LacI family transcriptional regulator [Streptomyces endophyticus]
MNPRTVTLIDVARRVGLSRTTVSEALSGKGRVSDETRERVRAAADELGYVGNRLARQLRTRSIGAIGYHGPLEARDLEFYMRFAFGVAGEALTWGVDTVLMVGEDSLSSGRQLGGVIAVDPGVDDPVVTALIRAQVPVVAVGRYESSEGLRAAVTLEARHAELQKDLLERLGRKGCRRFELWGMSADITSAFVSDAQHVFEAWTSKGGPSGLSGATRTFAKNPTPESVQRAVREALDRGVDAIVCGVQGLATQAEQALAQVGDSAGRAGIAVASFASDPPLATGPVIDLSPREYGATAARLLSDAMAEPPVGAHVWFEGGRLVDPQGWGQRA